MPSFTDIFHFVDYRLVFAAVILFFVGYTLAPTVCYKKYSFLTAYPFFIIRTMEKYVKKNWHPVSMFAVLFLLNSTSLFVNVISAFVPGLPLLFAVWLGINIGVVMFDTLGGELYFAALFNPVSFLELPAAWLSFALAFHINFGDIAGITTLSMTTALSYFAASLLPLLFIAAIIETGLMVFERKQRKENEHENGDD